MRTTLTTELGRFTPPPVTPEQEREAEEFERFQEREAWRRRLRDAGIPEKYRCARLSECDPRVCAYAEGVMDGKGDGLLLAGPYGAGKTYAACAVLAVVARLFPVTFAPMTELVEVASLFERGALSRYRNTRLLCLDDLGKERPTEFAMEQVYGIVDQRWREGKPTVITTNHAQPELFAHFTRIADKHTANAIMSRILGMCEVVELAGPDRRFMKPEGANNSY